MQPAVVRRVKAGLAQHRLSLPPAAVAGDHGRADRAAIGIDAGQLDLEPIGTAREIVAQQAGGLVEVDDQDVHIAIVVEIAESAAAAGARLGKGAARLFEELFEAAVAEIAEQHPRRRRRIPLVLSGDLRVNTAGHEEDVRQAAVVQIRQARPPAHVAGLDPDPRAQRHVVEVPFPVIAVQHVGVIGKVRLEQVQAAAAVVVADRHAHAGLLGAVLADSAAAL